MVFCILTLPPNPQCVTAHPTILWENEGSTSMYIMAFIDRRDEIGGFESTRLWSTTSKQATRQLLLCYRRKPQSKCSMLLVEAELHHNVPHTCEERCLHSSRWSQKKKSREMHVNAPALPTSGFGVEKKKMWISQTDALHRDSFTEYGVNFECDAWPQCCVNAVH